MKSDDRLKALWAIWIGFAIAAGFSFAGNQETGSNDLWLALIFAAAAIIGSVVVMRLKMDEGEEAAQASTSKHKRDEPSFYRLIDEMDDAELAELRRRLNAMDTAESAPLEDLVRQEQKR